MSRNQNTILRCAIYTRKSSAEGLEQSFNSLDAQRESCEAFISSQRHEGWRVVATRYDDGGYSGGTMERRESNQGGRCNLRDPPAIPNRNEASFITLR